MPDERCLACLNEITEKAIKLSTSNQELQKQLQKELTGYIQKEFATLKLPDFSTKIFAIIAEKTGTQDPFLEIKIKSNKEFLKILPKLKDFINEKKQKEAIYSIILYSIAANMIDFSTGGHQVDFDETITNILEFPEEGLQINDFDKLYQLILQSKNIILLSDNCGEVVIDNFLTSYLTKKMNKKVFLGLKGSPIANDCTVRDFRRDGLKESATETFVVSNSFGWNYNQTTDRFKDLLEKADLIIVKGQSNYETTLNNLVRYPELGFPPIFNILRTKCKVISNHLGVPLGSNVVKQMYPHKEKLKITEIVDC